MSDHVTPNAAAGIVSGIMAKWAAGFSRLDADKLSSLYSKHALFFGSNPKLYRGREGVAAYFNALPRWRSSAVEFTDVVAEQASPDLINVAATASFDVDHGATKLSVKITWVIVREDGDWKIVSHHVSSRTPLI
jgi:ketosteroid isomerase-like protein